MPALAVLCAYYNFTGAPDRLRNLHRFSDMFSTCRPRVPLFVAALNTGPAPLPPDWPNIIPVTVGDMLWQKERLLQIGINRLLAEGYENIAWFDADITFGNIDWPQRILAALEQYKVVQCFSFVCRAERRRYRQPSIIKYYRERIQSTPCHGLAWAARSDVLRKLELYQHAIIGGGDAAFFGGCYHRNYAAVPGFIGSKNKARRSHYAAWAKRCRQVVGSSLGYVDQFLLSAGHKRSKKQRRFQLLDAYAFDPHTDVVCNENEGFRWGSNKPGLHEQVALYCQSKPFQLPRS